MTIKTYGALGFLRDAKGATSVFFALSLIGIISVVGIAFDYSNAGVARNKAQNVADSIALQVALTANEERDELLWSKPRRLRNYGYDDSPFMKETYVEAEFDDENQKVTVTVYGETPSSFLPIMGVSKIDFRVTSTAAYPQTATRPVSLFIVMDNSGSMGWSDPSGGTKLSNAKTALIGLLSSLRAIPNDDPKLVRMSLLAYSGRDSGMSGIGDTGIVTSRTVPPHWGVITDAKVNAMGAGGGTHPIGSLEQALEWMKSEQPYHKTENGEEEPARVVLFMTDGVNDPSDYCVAKETVTETRTTTNRPSSYTRRWRQYYRYRGRQYSYWVYEYEVQYDQCSEYENANERTLEICTELKDEGVEIYTVAYDLSAFSYNEQTAATAMLQACATTENHYQYSENGDALQRIFDKIGKTVADSVVRITS